MRPVQGRLRPRHRDAGGPRRLDGDELSVAPVRGTRWAAEDEDVLLDGVARTGQRRVLLPDRLVDLDALAGSGWAAVTCPTCGARWEDGGPMLSAEVRRDGRFPPSCLACGGSLPEWAPSPAVRLGRR